MVKGSAFAQLCVNPELTSVEPAIAKKKEAKQVTWSLRMVIKPYIITKNVKIRSECRFAIEVLFKYLSGTEIQNSSS